MTGTNVSLSQQVSQNIAANGLQDCPSDFFDDGFDFLAPAMGLSEPDNEHRTTSAHQNFTGVNGEVDHFIFATDIDGGSYIVNNYEPGSDWLIFISDSDDSVDITAIDGDVTYTNNNNLTNGHVHVNPVGDASGISVANIMGSATGTDSFILI